MEYSQKLLGQNIQKFREINKMSHLELAKKSGISKSYVVNLESGLGNSISFQKLANIAEALNIEIDDLLSNNLIKLSKVNNQNEIKLKILDQLSTFTDEQIFQFKEIVEAYLKFKDRQKD